MEADKDFVEKLKSELTKKGIFSEGDFNRLVLECKRNHKSLVESLFRNGNIPEREILAALSMAFGYAPINVATFIIEPEIIGAIPKEIAKKYQMLPIARYESTLTVAISDPTNLSALDDVHIRTGLRIKPTLAVPSQLESAIKKYYGDPNGAQQAVPTESIDQVMEEARLQVVTNPLGKAASDLSDLLEGANTTPIIRLVNHLLLEAIRRHASDIFIEPWERTMRVRYRVDGILEEVLNVPRSYVELVVSRIKVMSRLNIAERRVPQDGRFKARVFGREVDLRVSILPTSHGEKACLRILDTSAQAQDIDKLGFGPKELEIIKKISLKPHGMILVTGPTGSGKTTTLYAILQYLMSPEKNITTVEDPVEYQVPGINQVNVRDQVGLTFPVALRSILRQDPDIILIGEIRDLTTMDIAVKAALTGHLVLSTLHTNDATSALVRMVNMGIEPFLISSSVLMISAQRLVRKLCSVCKAPYTPDDPIFESMGIPSKKGLTFFRPKGCDQCRHLGLKGRTVLTELFDMRVEIRDLIMRGASNEQIRNLAREIGMKTLREAGIDKVKDGTVSVEEVLRVTSPDSVLEGLKV